MEPLIYASTRGAADDLSCAGRCPLCCLVHLRLVPESTTVAYRWHTRPLLHCCHHSHGKRSLDEPPDVASARIICAAGLYLCWPSFLRCGSAQASFTRHGDPQMNFRTAMPCTRHLSVRTRLRAQRARNKYSRRCYITFIQHARMIIHCCMKQIPHHKRMRKRKRHPTQAQKHLISSPMSHVISETTLLAPSSTLMNCLNHRRAARHSRPPTFNFLESSLIMISSNDIPASLFSAMFLLIVG